MSTIVLPVWTRLYSFQELVSIRTPHHHHYLLLLDLCNCKTVGKLRRPHSYSLWNAYLLLTPNYYGPTGMVRFSWYG